MFSVFCFQIISAVYLHESEAAPKLGLIKAKAIAAKAKLAVAKTKLAVGGAVIAKGVKVKAKLAAIKALAAVRFDLYFHLKCFHFLD